MKGAFSATVVPITCPDSLLYAGFSLSKAWADSVYFSQTSLVMKGGSMTTRSKLRRESEAAS